MCMVGVYASYWVNNVLLSETSLAKSKSFQQNVSTAIQLSSSVAIRSLANVWLKVLTLG